MKKIAIVTSTRAEYGLLRPLILKLLSDTFFDVKVAVTGTHLSQEFGMTVNEIINDRIPIDKKIEIVMSSDSNVAVSKSMGLALISFSEYFEELSPDGVVVLGDRFETLAVCCAAMNARIPIIHIHGGELTEGLIDDAIRHSISKMSLIHFTSTEKYRKRVIQLGESPDRVFNVGALGVENALNVKTLSESELSKSIGFELGSSYVVGTFHPVTLEHMTAAKQIEELLLAISNYPEINFLFTKANSDMNGRVINQMLLDYSKRNNHLFLLDSLGFVRYLSAVKYSKFVIGNSSSGLIEVPSFHIPTVNIGDRQKGRIYGDTVINCLPDKISIKKAIDKALDREFVSSLKNTVNPYGKGNTSDRIASILREIYSSDSLSLKKNFYDLDYTLNE